MPAARTQMRFEDSVEAINAAVKDGHHAGHNLGGFTRRTGSFGYGFVGRCRRCGAEVLVRRGSDGWSYEPPVPCSTEDQ